MKNVTVNAAIRRPAIHSRRAIVLLRVLWGRDTVKTLTIGVRIDPENWDFEMRLVKKNDPNHMFFNMKIRSEILRIEKEVMSVTLLGGTLTKQRRKKIVEGQDPGQNFYQFCNQWISQKYNRLETIRTYNSEITKMKYYRPELAFGDIDYEFLICCMV